MTKHYIRFGEIPENEASGIYHADKDMNKNAYISMTRPDDPTKCTLFWREKGGQNEPTN